MCDGQNMERRGSCHSCHALPSQGSSSYCSFVSFISAFQQHAVEVAASQPLQADPGSHARMLWYRSSRWGRFLQKREPKEPTRNGDRGRKGRKDGRLERGAPTAPPVGLLMGGPLELEGARLGQFRLDVEGYVVEERPQDAVAEAVVVEVHLQGGRGHKGIHCWRM